jgi:aspartokinase-like uncharacterized kinase
MIPTSPVVVKVGGSLLTLPDLGERLESVLENLSGRNLLFVIGGGAAADEIRRLDQRFHISAARAHWDAIAAMTFNSRLVSRLLGFVPLVSNKHEAVVAWQSHSALILDSGVFLREGHGDFSRRLPELWDVTSDSIAVSVALDWPCEQVLFCKSCPPVSLQVSEICNAGQLDEYVPKLLPAIREARIQVSWLDLCANDYSIQLLLNSLGKED